MARRLNLTRGDLWWTAYFAALGFLLATVGA